MSSVAMTDRPAVGATAAAGHGWRRADVPSDLVSPTLIVGLGNPILGDDGVGWKVIDELEVRVGRGATGTHPVELARMSVGGLTLMELLVGYERAIVVDAVRGEDRVGSVWSLPLEAVGTRRNSHLDSAHDASLAEAIEAGRALGARLPNDITVVGIAVRRVDEFDDRLSPSVGGAVRTAADAIVRLLAGHPERAD